jgi:hypothetical protein
MSDILDFLAGRLARLIGTPPSSAKGLLRLAIHDRFPGSQNEALILSIADYKIVFSINVKDRLARVHFRDVDKVIDEMSKILDDMMSVITMTRV